MWEDIKAVFAFIGVVIGWLQLATYAMALTRWYGTEYLYFWRGFKELIWALCPIVNVFYVWDWWLVAIAYVVALFD